MNKINNALAIAFSLVTSKQFRNGVEEHINKCEEFDGYKPYIKWKTKEELENTIYDFGTYLIKVEEFDKEFELKLYDALEKGLEQFKIYTRSDTDRLYVKKSIVELA